MPSYGAADDVSTGVVVAGAGCGHCNRLVSPAAVPVVIFIRGHGNGDVGGKRRGDGNATGDEMQMRQGMRDWSEVVEWLDFVYVCANVLCRLS